MKWIKVEDRLPKVDLYRNSNRVLIYYPGNGSRFIAKMFRQGEIHQWSIYNNEGDNILVDNSDVSHWRHLGDIEPPENI